MARHFKMFSCRNPQNFRAFLLIEIHNFSCDAAPGDAARGSGRLASPAEIRTIVLRLRLWPIGRERAASLLSRLERGHSRLERDRRRAPTTDLYFCFCDCFAVTSVWSVETILCAHLAICVVSRAVTRDRSNSNVCDLSRDLSCVCCEFTASFFTLLCSVRDGYRA